MSTKPPSPEESPMEFIPDVQSTPPGYLFGREEERKFLAQSLEETKQKSHLLLLSGRSGIGKTSLARSLAPLVKAENGFFIEGKFETLREQTPFLAPLLAIENLIEQILVRNEAEIETWRLKLKEALGARAVLLADYLPMVGKFLGKTETPSLSDRSEETPQFLEALIIFFTVFSEGNFPLVLFIDDLQWADKSSLALIRRLLQPHHKGKILILLAYRKEEIKREHPFSDSLAEFINEKIPTKELSIHPLRKEVVIEYLKANGLRQDLELIEFVFDKTEGNPFFMKELLNLLLSEQNLKIEGFRKETLKCRPICNNLIDLLSYKLQKLPYRLQEILKLAACTGGYFDLELLLKISPFKAEEITEDLKQAVIENLIEVAPLPQRKNRSETAFRFTHDKWTQAAKSLIEPQIKKLVHLEIGNHLLQAFSEEELEINAFLVAYQLNLATDILRSPEERSRAAKINLLAAKKAISSGAYPIAENYIKAGLAFLPENRWESSYELTHQLMLLSGEATYLQGHFKEAENKLNALINLSQGHEDKLKVFILLLRLFTSIAEYDRALKYGDEALNLIGIKTPKRWLKFTILKEYLSARLKIGKHPLETFAALPKMEDKSKLSQIELLSLLIPAAYLRQKERLPFYILKGLNLTIKYGINPLSPMVFISWGILSNMYSRNIPEMKKTGNYALSLCEKKEFKKHAPGTYFLYGQFISPFSGDLEECSELLEKAFHEGIAQGDIIYAIFSLITRGMTDFIRGVNLNELERRLGAKVEFIENYREKSRDQALKGMIQACRALRGETKHPASFDSKDFSESDFFNSLKDNGLTYSLFVLITIKIELAYLFNSPEQALLLVEKAAPLTANVKDQLLYSEYLFFWTLSLIKLYQRKDRLTKHSYKNKIRDALKFFNKLSQNSKLNFTARYYLLMAESEALFGTKLEAIKAYETALVAIKNEGFPQIEGLILECFAEFWIKEGLKEPAARFLELSLLAYKRWGATAKVDEIKQRIEINGGSL